MDVPAGNFMNMPNDVCMSFDLTKMMLNSDPHFKLKLTIDNNVPSVKQFTPIRMESRQASNGSLIEFPIPLVRP